MTPQLRRPRQYSPAQAQAIVKDVYGIDATATPVDGEFDENFRVQSAAGSWVLKIMREGCSREFVDMQIRALEHLRAKLPGMPWQDVCSSSSRQPMVALENGRLVWLLTWLPGTALDDWRPHALDLIESFGELLGDVDRALADFDHPAAHREFQWDLSRAGWIRAHLNRVQSASRRQLADRVLDIPTMAGVPHSAIHGDANLDNVLILDGRIAGLIDFGDLHHGATVADVAIAAAYTAWGSQDPLSRMAALARGYHRRNVLTEAEIAVLFPLAMTRLAVSALSSEANNHPAELTW